MAAKGGPRPPLPVYIAWTDEPVFLQLLQDAAKDVSYSKKDGSELASPTPHPFSVDILRPVGAGADPDGDALSAFDQPSFPAGMLLRRRRYFDHPEVFSTRLLAPGAAAAEAGVPAGEASIASTSGRPADASLNGTASFRGATSFRGDVDSVGTASINEHGRYLGHRDRPLLLKSPPVARPGCNWKMVLGPAPSQHRALIKLKRRGVREPRAKLRAALADAACRRPPPAPYCCLLGWDIPTAVEYLWALADNVGAYNSERGGHMVPLMDKTVTAMTAALTIQSLFRAHRARRALEPGLCARLLERRAAVCVQRYYRAHLLHCRIVMLTRLKAYLKALPNTDVLCLTKAAHERLEATLAQQRWRQTFPEQRLHYCFDQRGSMFILDDSGGAAMSVVRPEGLPTWVNPQMVRLGTMDLSRGGGTNLEVTDPLAAGPIKLLDHKVTMLAYDVTQPPPEDWALAPHLDLAAGKEHGGQPHSILRFNSALEARRRAALLLVLTWDHKTSDGVELVKSPWLHVGAAPEPPREKQHRLVTPKGDFIDPTMDARKARPRSAGPGRAEGDERSPSSSRPGSARPGSASSGSGTGSRRGARSRSPSRGPAEGGNRIDYLLEDHSPVREWRSSITLTRAAERYMTAADEQGLKLPLGIPWDPITKGRPMNEAQRELARAHVTRTAALERSEGVMMPTQILSATNMTYEQSRRAQRLAEVICNWTVAQRFRVAAAVRKAALRTRLQRGIERSQAMGLLARERTAWDYGRVSERGACCPGDAAAAVELGSRLSGEPVTLHEGTRTDGDVFASMHGSGEPVHKNARDLLKSKRRAAKEARWEREENEEAVLAKREADLRERCAMKAESFVHHDYVLRSVATDALVYLPGPSSEEVNAEVDRQRALYAAEAHALAAAVRQAHGEIVAANASDRQQVLDATRAEAGAERAETGRIMDAIVDATARERVAVTANVKRRAFLRAGLGNARQQTALVSAQFAALGRRAFKAESRAVAHEEAAHLVAETAWRKACARLERAAAADRALLRREEIVLSKEEDRTAVNEVVEATRTYWLEAARTKAEPRRAEEISLRRDWFGPAQCVRLPAKLARHAPATSPRERGLRAGHFEVRTPLLTRPVVSVSEAKREMAAAEALFGVGSLDASSGGWDQEALLVLESSMASAASAASTLRRPLSREISGVTLPPIKGRETVNVASASGGEAPGRPTPGPQAVA